MEKGCPFRKTKHDREAGSSGTNKEKTPHNRGYVHVEFVHQQLEENWPVP
jgi:hypothetical protein